MTFSQFTHLFRGSRNDVTLRKNGLNKIFKITDFPSYLMIVSSLGKHAPTVLYALFHIIYHAFFMFSSVFHQTT